MTENGAKRGVYMAGYESLVGELITSSVVEFNLLNKRKALRGVFTNPARFPLVLDNMEYTLSDARSLLAFLFGGDGEKALEGMDICLDWADLVNRLFQKYKKTDYNYEQFRDDWQRAYGTAAGTPGAGEPDVLG